MSGYTKNSIVHNGRLDDGVEMISKPFQREHLARKVFEALAAPDGEQPATNSSNENIVNLRNRRGE